MTFRDGAIVNFGVASGQRPGVTVAASDGRAIKKRAATARIEPMLRRRRTRCLFPRELCFSLLVVRAEAFLRVFALEELLLQLPLERQRGLERDLCSGLHAALDAADRLRGLVRRAEAPRVLHHPVPPLLAVLLGGPDVVDDAEAVRFLEVEETPFDHHFNRLRLADDA